MAGVSLAPLLLTGLLAIGASPAPGADPERNRPAVPLFIPSVSTPIETAGSGLGPDLSIRLRVDANGRPISVEVLRVDPSSSHDELFRRDAQKALRRCRFAPALLDGVPVEAEVPLTVRYPPLTGDARPGATPVSFGLGSEDRLEAEARDILMLSPEARRGLLEITTRKAIRHFRGQAVRHEAGRFTVYAGRAQGDFAPAIGRNLQALFDFLEAGFRPAMAPQPDTDQFAVLVFDSMAEYQSLSTSFDGGFDWSQGFYMPQGMLAFHRQVVTDEDLLGTLLHEAVHAYFDHHVVRPGVLLPRWLGEGYAEYIGNSEVKDGALNLGKIRKRENYRFDFGRIRTRSSVRFTIDDVKKALRRKGAPGLTSVVNADIETFYGEHRELNYPLSWLVVHFLHHGRPEWTTARFSQLLLYVAEGFPVGEALRFLYGSPESLEAEFRKYVKRL